MNLPQGYTARPSTWDDAEAVAALITACRTATGEPEVTAQELRDDWEELDDLAESAVVVIAPDGQIVASADLLNRRFVRVSVYGYVHPDREGLGLGTFLLQWGERWIQDRLDRAPEGVQVVLEFYANAANTAARALIESNGYPLERTIYVMEMTIGGPPPAPQWPEGIQVRTYRPGEDEQALFEVGEAGFRDSWSRPPGTLESWTRPTRVESFDGSLWYLPMDRARGEPAGFCLCVIASGRGWVRSLGVRPSWRRRGLGLALLHHAFGELYARGIREVSLSVDADSPTGAPRLYTRAGMHVAYSYHVYRREVLPGRDFTEALA